MTMSTVNRAPRPSGLADVLDVVLDKDSAEAKRPSSVIDVISVMTGESGSRP